MIMHLLPLFIALFACVSLEKFTRSYIRRGERTPSADTASTGKGNEVLASRVLVAYAI